MALWRVLMLLIFSATLRGVESQFITPPDGSDTTIQNPVYTVGQQLNIAWVANISSADLVMWQTNNNSFLELQVQTSATSYPWIVSFEGFNPKVQDIFFFQIFQHGSTSPTLGSHSFKIVDPSSSTSTTATSSTRTSATAGTTTTNSSSTHTSSPSSSKLSGGAIGGIVVGAVAAIALVAGAFFMLRRRKRTTQDQPKPAELGHFLHYQHQELPAEQHYGSQYHNSQYGQPSQYQGSQYQGSPPPNNNEMSSEGDRRSSPWNVSHQGSPPPRQDEVYELGPR